MAMKNSYRAERSRHRQRGISLLEAVIFAVVLTMILQAMTSSTIMVSQASSAGRAQTTAMAQGEIAVDRMIAELRMTSTGADPKTGLPIISLADNGNGAELTFRRVVNFGQNSAGQLELIWSTPILYRVQDGTMLRNQDGQDRVILRNVANHNFVLDEIGRVMVTVEIDMPTAAETTRRAEHSQVVQPMF